MTRKCLWFGGLFAAAACTSACTSSGPSDPMPGAPDATTGSAGTIDAAPVTLELPFAVDDWYAPSGYMGDGESPGEAE